MKKVVLICGVLAGAVLFGFGSSAKACTFSSGGNYIGYAASVNLYSTQHRFIGTIQGSTLYNSRWQYAAVANGPYVYSPRGTYLGIVSGYVFQMPNGRAIYGSGCTEEQMLLASLLTLSQGSTSWRYGSGGFGGGSSGGVFK